MELALIHLLKLLSLLFLPTFAFAQAYQGLDQQALLEAGAGVAYGTVPHYPGSDQSTSLVLPFPALIYRGERYRLDEDGGARTRFFYTDWMELNVSVGGSLPVSSKDNRARSGMPKLDAMIELGPGLIFHFFNKRNSDKFRLSLNFPIRQAISSDLKYTKARGQIFNPLLYSFYQFTKSFSLFAGVSAYWATKDYNSYLYNVEPRFATATRPSYQANGGYVVTNYALAFIKSVEKISVFGAVSLNDASWSSNKNSPLFVKSSNIGFALGFTYFFYSIP